MSEKYGDYFQIIRVPHEQEEQIFHSKNYAGKTWSNELKLLRNWRLRTTSKACTHIKDYVNSKINTEKHYQTE